MKTELCIALIDKSELFLDVKKDIWTATGKIANMLLIDFNKNNFSLEERLSYLDTLSKSKNIKANIINTCLANEDGADCSWCNEYGYYSDGYDNYDCQHCKNSRLVTNFINRDSN